MSYPKTNSSSRKNNTTIHPSSIKKGTGSGNLYSQQSKVGNVVDKQWKPSK